MKPDTLKASRRFNARSVARAYGRRTAYLTITAQAGDHFSVTGQAYSAAFGNRSPFLCGCIHEEAAHFWPAIKPLIALHLSDAQTGAPMHAEVNGWYWLAGAAGGLGEEHHGGSGTNGRPAAECLAILASHLRIDLAEAEAIRDGCAMLGKDARAHFAAYVDTLRPRWLAEAEAGRNLIRELATPAEVAA